MLLLEGGGRKRLHTPLPGLSFNRKAREHKKGGEPVEFVKRGRGGGRPFIKRFVYRPRCFVGKEV